MPASRFRSRSSSAMRSNALVTAWRVCVLSAISLLAPAHAEADWIAAVFLGHAATRPSTVTFNIPDSQTVLDVEDVDYRGDSFKSPQYYGYRVMWVPDALPWLGIEGEYIHAKVYAQTTHTFHMRGTLNGAP